MINNNVFSSTGPRVTVVVTVYKRLDYIEECLNCITAQSFKDIEIILCDDAATEYSKNLVDRVGDHRLRYLPSEENIGVARAVARALELSRGEYIAIINDDDLWRPTLLQTLVEALEADKELVLAFCGQSKIDKDGQLDIPAADESDRIQKRSMISAGKIKEPFRDLVLNQVTSMVMGSVVRRSILVDRAIFPEVGPAYDFWMICLVALSMRPVFYVKERLFLYRIHSEMETVRRYPEKWESEKFIFRYLIGQKVGGKSGVSIKMRYGSICAAIGFNRMRFQQLTVARSNFVEGILVSLNLKCVIGLIIVLAPSKIRDIFVEDCSG